MSKLILIMVDGISADYFESIRHQLPHLDRLARSGTQVNGVTPEMCGTSCPGRTSIVAGVAPSEHGIYGNHIWDGEQFRWANPEDVRVPTLPAYAKAQGLDVAGLGYGMIRPQDCSLYKGPWWVDEMLMRGRDAEPMPADTVWLSAGADYDDQGRLAALQAQGINLEIVAPNKNPDIKLQLGMLADQQLLDVAAGLAASAQAPDFMLLEIGITDYFLHKYGADHALTEWSLRAADAQIGTLLERLEQASVLDRYNLLICSDHGHAPMCSGLYVDRLLGDEVVWSSEGGVLMVKPRDQAQAIWVQAALAEYGIELWNNDHLPPEQQDQLLTFVVPEGSDISFESQIVGASGVSGPSKYLSNHGMRPGSRADMRFCIFNGPAIPRQRIESGLANQIAPTMAAILGVETPWQAEPLFTPLTPSNTSIECARDSAE
ncbi:alkaline phosphatase family protein [Marinobacterium jannaschii]|uniref:alkaline phosphatase family protein n=1 Tax=Marinobacterium jannaschii TaxID=64970 RepID=UPI000688861A|nr:alkaline phosphatase family protein [Marinobacterium jannaschii]